MPFGNLVRQFFANSTTVAPTIQHAVTIGLRAFSGKSQSEEERLATVAQLQNQLRRAIWPNTDRLGFLEADPADVSLSDCMQLARYLDENNKLGDLSTLMRAVNEGHIPGVVVAPESCFGCRGEGGRSLDRVFGHDLDSHNVPRVPSKWQTVDEIRKDLGQEGDSNLRRAELLLRLNLQKEGYRSRKPSDHSAASLAKGVVELERAGKDDTAHEVRRIAQTAFQEFDLFR